MRREPILSVRRVTVYFASPLEVIMVPEKEGHLLVKVFMECGVLEKSQFESMFSDDATACRESQSARLCSCFSGIQKGPEHSRRVRRNENTAIAGWRKRACWAVWTRFLLLVEPFES